MLENLNYIYMAMYAVDLRGSIGVFLWCVTLLLPIASLLASGIMAAATDDKTISDSTFWKWIKILWFGTLAILCITIPSLVLLPSKNTMKAYIGVKAVQSVGDYLESETDLPARTKATVTKLWDRVDGYISTIEVEDEAEKLVQKGKRLALDSLSTIAKEK